MQWGRKKLYFSQISTGKPQFYGIPVMKNIITNTGETMHDGSYENEMKINTEDLRTKVISLGLLVI